MSKFAMLFYALCLCHEALAKGHLIKTSHVKNASMFYIHMHVHKKMCLCVTWSCCTVGVAAHTRSTHHHACMFVHVRILQTHNHNQHNKILNTGNKTCVHIKLYTLHIYIYDPIPWKDLGVGRFWVLGVKSFSIFPRGLGLGCLEAGCMHKSTENNCITNFPKSPPPSLFAVKSL